MSKRAFTSLKKRISPSQAMRKVVVIGGGAGSYTVLKGLKAYPLQISSIVSMFDSGGSTGKLRTDLGVLPPGDIRRCLLALADEDQENALSDLFAFRFNGAADNHSLGNLLITAAQQNYGSLVIGIQKLSQLLNLQGKVIPVSTDDAHLYAELIDGTTIEEEDNICVPKTENRAAIQKVYLSPKAKANPEALLAISEADLIVLAPGDLYTSLIPNLLVEGIPQALQNSSAKIIHVCNAMTKKGETDGYTCSKFVTEVEKYIQRRIDFVLFNEGHINSSLLQRYRQEQQFPVVFDMLQDPRAVLANLNEENNPLLIRYDSKKLARELIRLC